jgi:hypothetical protein
MTQQTPLTFTLFGLTFAQKTRTLSERKVPGAWPEDEVVYNIPGGWVDSDDDGWCGHTLCWIEDAFGVEHYCSRHEVVEILLSGLKL